MNANLPRDKLIQMKRRLEQVRYPVASSAGAFAGGLFIPPNRNLFIMLIAPTSFCLPGLVIDTSW